MGILAFCRKRDISTQGISISHDVEWYRKRHDRTRVGLKICLPRHFPPKYDRALHRAVGGCLAATLGRGLDDDSFDTRIRRPE